VTRRKVVFVVGPTASGKSKIAIDVAKQKNGVIINADSLQVYNALPILTSQPSMIDTLEIQHVLYGFVPFYNKVNAFMWATNASRAIEDVLAQGKTPILAGGTGLYIKCLIHGMSDMPLVDDKIRLAANVLASQDYRTLCEAVYGNDANLRQFIKPENHRQMIRAYEILVQTGFSVRYFWNTTIKPFLKDVEHDFIVPNFVRSELYEKINDRFLKMIENGAIEEVESFAKATETPKKYAVFQAIGAVEIYSYLNGEYTFTEMIEASCARSRRYAKRQITWIKNQFSHELKL
jgi:tRNA dimethylallyltransferase